MISFIILNYKSFDDTIECIHSIQKIKTNKKISIIVVDNNSLDSVQEKEIKKYTKDLVLLTENVGFAKGNNAGCEYAIKKYQPDFLCVINSDTVIEQSEFIDIIYELYDQYHFDMLGPKILPESSESCNPFYAYSTIDEVQERIHYTERLLQIYQNKLLRNLLNIYISFKKIFRKKDTSTNGVEEQINVALHGCALIFSKKYYKQFDSVFYPNTFLFHEEEFLYLRAKQNHLVTLYSPRLEIYHKEGQSVAKVFKNKKYDSLIFRNKEILKSLKLLEKEMLNQDEDVNI